MKSKIAILVAFVILLATTTFASSGGNLNPGVSSTFNQKFNGAKEVRWTTSEKYVKATFKLNEQVMFAYFTPAGEMIGVTRNVLSSQLPINLQIDLKKILQDGWITELLEFASEEETVYYATIENADQKVILKSSGTNTWIVNKKAKKEAL